MATKISAGNTMYDVENALYGKGSFVRSNGKVVSRIYERLTKASRRRGYVNYDRVSVLEESYRQGVYDALSALRGEVSDV